MPNCAAARRSRRSVHPLSSFRPRTSRCRPRTHLATRAKRWRSAMPLNTFHCTNRITRPRCPSAARQRPTTGSAPCSPGPGSARWAGKGAAAASASTASSMPAQASPCGHDGRLPQRWSLSERACRDKTPSSGWKPGGAPLPWPTACAAARGSLVRTEALWPILTPTVGMTAEDASDGAGGAGALPLRGLAAPPASSRSSPTAWLPCRDTTVV